MKNIDMDLATCRQIEEALGKRLRQVRLDRNFTQQALAAEAGIAVRTLRNLEDGEGVSLDTFIRVLKALRLHNNLKILLPDPSVRPVDRVQRPAKERIRASGGGIKPKAASTVWAWKEKAPLA